MKIEKKDKAFQPIQITIETQKEKDMLIAIFGAQGTVSDALENRAVEFGSLKGTGELRELMTSCGIYQRLTE